MPLFVYTMYIHRKFFVRHVGREPTGVVEMYLQNASNEMNHPPAVGWRSLLQEGVVLAVAVTVLHLIF